MYNVKRVSKKIGFTIIFFLLLVGAAFAVAVHFGITKLILEIGPILKGQVDPAAAKGVWHIVLEYYPKFWYTVFPAMMIFSLIGGILGGERSLRSKIISASLRFDATGRAPNGFPE